MPDRAHAVKPMCGDGVRAGSEQCDIDDDFSCPGQCQADCTCPSVEPEPARAPLRAIAGDGIDLGTPLASNSDTSFAVFNEDLGLVLTKNVLLGEPAAVVLFGMSFCEGPGSVSDATGGPGVGFGNSLAGHLIGRFPQDQDEAMGEGVPFNSPPYYVVGTEIVVETFTVLSRLRANGCFSLNTDIEERMSATEFTGVLPYSIPVMEPFHIELAE